MKTKLFVSVTVCSIVAFGLQAQDSLTNGLVAYYPFNGNANDASGNGNDGTVYGATLTADRFGNTNSAYSFDGVSDYIEVASNPTLLFSDQLTISAWIQWVNVPGSQFSIASKINGDGWTGGFDFVLFKDLLGQGLDGITLEGDFSNGTISAGGHPAGWGYSPITRTTNWQQVVCVYSNQIQTFWINGVPTSPIYNSAFGNIGQSSDPLRIGRRTDINNNWFSGSIDDVRIYNRALSADELARLYAIESKSQHTSIAKAVRMDHTNLVVGVNYQLQISSDLNTWTNLGVPFTAAAPTNSQYVDVQSWNAFFRLIVP